MKKILAITLSFSFIVVFAAEPVLVWDRFYNNGGDDLGNDVVVDSYGNVYVAGESEDGTDMDAFIVVYTPDGDIDRTMSFDGGLDDGFLGISVDDQGNVYAAGYSFNGNDNDGLIVRFDPSGDTVWSQIVEDPIRDDWQNAFYDIEVGGPWIYVVGFYESISSSILWVQTRDTSDGSLIDSYYYVSADMNDDDVGYGITLDAPGNAYVIGRAGNDYVIIKLDINLDTVWTNTYDAGDVDIGTGIALDDAGFIYATGMSGEWFTAGYYTMKCEPNGTLEWGDKYSPGITNWGYGIAVDDEYVYVSGCIVDTADTNYNTRTLCYNKQGEIIWEEDYDRGRDGGRRIALDDAGFMYVTGITEPEMGTPDILTLKYELVTGVEEGPSSEPSITLAVTDNLTSTPTIRYSLPAGQSGTLTFYSADGRKLETYNLDPAQSEFTWTTDNPTGVYFARMVSSGECIQAKIIKTR